MISNALITHDNPKSIVSEAYRMLRTNLHYSNVDREIKSIMITSANMNEGKTTTACNLAVTLAQSDNKTLYIGADLRKPTGHKFFGVHNGVGLTSLITGKVLPETAIVEIKEITNLFILPAGPIPPNPSEMLISNKMKNLMAEFKEEFDYIIVDVPPINSVTDAPILSNIVDGVIVVASSKETNKDSFRNAVKSLQKVNAHIIGVVISKFNIKKGDYYYTPYYSIEDDKKSKGLFKRNKSRRNKNKTKKEDNNTRNNEKKEVAISK